MPSKLQYYQSVAEQAAQDIAANRGSWTGFLDAAARMYKYTFPDQLLIHAQRPEAIACAPIETWNETFNRWVKRGTKGIALIDDTGSYPKLRYVFDVADTDAVLHNSRPVYLWEMQQAHREIVLEALDNIYDDVGDTLADSFRNIARQLAREYYDDNSREIRFRAEDSHLDELDELSISTVFEDALANSIAYTLMSRCGLETANHFADEDFRHIREFNTLDMVYALGTATNELSAQVLRDVEIVIKKYERQQAAERSAENERGTDIHTGRELPTAGHQAGRAAEGAGATTGQIRTDAESLSERTSHNNLQPNVVERDTVPTPTGNRGVGDPAVGATDGDIDNAEPASRQSYRPNGLDSGDEQHEVAGQRDGVGRIDLRRLNETPVTPISETLSTSSITLDEVDSILRDGGNEKNSILRIAAHFAKNLSHDDNMAYLRREYLNGPYNRLDETPSGKGVQFGVQQTAVWFDANGITIGRGKSALSATDYTLIAWEQAAMRVKDLYDAGMYVSHDILDEALFNESKERADDVIEFYSDISRGLSDIKYNLREAMTAEQREATKDDWKDRRYLIHGISGFRDKVNTALESDPEPTSGEIMALYNEAISISEPFPPEWKYNEAHPIVDETVTALLRDKGEIGDDEIGRGVAYSDQSNYADIMNRLKKDVAILTAEPHVPMRLFRNPQRVLDNLEKAGLPAHGFPVADYTPLNHMRFITNDEVDRFLAKGGNYSEGRLRVLSHFLHEHTPKERTDFIKRVYGHGGGTWIDGYASYEPGKGLTLKRPGCDDVKLSWNHVVRRTRELIESGHYVTSADLASVYSYERLFLAKTINNFFYNLPKDYERPFGIELDFHYAKEDEWNALNNLLDNPEKVGALLAHMQYLYANTPADDRYHDIRKYGIESLSAYHAGTYTLFPGLANLPDPEIATGRTLPEMQGRRTRATNESSPHESQMSLLDFEQRPVLPSADEQRDKIVQANERKQAQEQDTTKTDAFRSDMASAASAPAPISQNEIDELLLAIGDEDKSRLAAQFANNPRSREAVALVREIYSNIEETALRKDANDEVLFIYGESTGVTIVADVLMDNKTHQPEAIDVRLPAETVTLSWAALVKRIAELVNTGQLAAVEQEAPSLNEHPIIATRPILAEQTVERKPTVYDEYLQVKTDFPSHIVIFQVGDFYEFYGKDAEIAAQVLNIALTSREVVGLTEPITTASTTLDMLDDSFDNLYYAGHSVAASSLNPDGTRYVRSLEQEDESLQTPIIPAESVELDFDTVAQTVLGRVMQDTGFATALNDAPTRGALRRSLNTALDAVIDQYQVNEPQVYHTYHNDDDFNDKLFDYVYRQSWELRQQREVEAAPQLENTDKLTAELLVSHPGTDYYLFHFPNDRESPAALSLDNLSLITKQASNYIICADVLYMSEESIAQRSIEFRKMPRDLELLSADVQARIYETKPGYLEELVRQNLILRGFAVPEDLIKTGITEYRELGGRGNAGDIGEFIEDAYIGEDSEFELLDTDEIADEALGQDEPNNIESVQLGNAHRYAVGDSVYYQNKLYIIDSIDDSAVYLQDPSLAIPVKMHLFLREFDEILSRDERNAHLLPATQDTTPPQQSIPPQQDTPAPETPRDTVRLVNQEALRPSPANFRITDDHLGEGGAKTKFRYNMDAIHVLKDLAFDKRTATPEEQQVLSRYVGFGSISQVFDPNNEKWTNEHYELLTTLSPQEWDSARSSTLNAYFTSPTVIKAIYETVERMGFKTGNILEPSCGVGNFFGLLPDSMAGSKLYGVELDSITAQIAMHLYPKANIQETGFERTDMPDAFFDLAVGNVPFGDYSVHDKRYNKHKFRIHDYFFAKSLDQVRPGGVVAFITSKGTLDKVNPDMRKYLAQSADLLGAVRLPNNAFKKNAGTEVTADIIFLQKRDRPIDIEPDWVHLGQTEDGIPINRYFVDNPEMVLGKMSVDDGHRMYASDNISTCIPIEGADLAEQLRTALFNIQGKITEAELDDMEGVDNHAIPADPRVKNFSYALVTPANDGDITAASITEGQVYFRENSLMYPVDLPATTLERIKGMIAIRDCTHELIALQVDEHGEDEIKAKQAELNTIYDDFTAEYGLINSTANSRAFNADDSFYLLSSLEVLDGDNKLERKADMFTMRTIKPQVVITKVDTANDALAASLNEKGYVDLDYMGSITGFDRDALISKLKNIIYLNIGNADDQKKTYVTADEYLSGNIREKLELAKAAQATIGDGSLDVNVTALEAVLPKHLEAHEISVRLGSTWIDKEYIQQFMHELLPASKIHQRDYHVNYSPRTGEWQVAGRGRTLYSDFHATVTYGTNRMNAYEILHDTLNLRDVRVYDYVKDADGKDKRELNKKATMLAQQKQELIKQTFKDWIWEEPERRQALVALYNEKFNSTRPREFDGSHLIFPGMSVGEKLRPHQANGAARIMYGGNTLLAHVVGAGKTFAMIAAAMEMKRIGLCHKSLIAVPNHITEQWASQFMRLYPSANILVARKKDFEMRNRKKFCAKIATGDYDAVIIGHSQLEKIPLSKERQQRILVEQIQEIEDAMQELMGDEDERFTVKQMERTKKSLELHLSKLLDGKKKDSVVTFEQLGIDRLFVDESHYYKNLFMHTKMRNIAGISQQSAQKAIDLFTKTRYMDELTGGKGNIHATGTPITNTLAEMYTNQRYLQYDTLIAKDLTHFDAWASTFSEPQTTIELAPEGTGYRARTRLAKFHNLPELMSMFRDFADIQTADMLDLPTPEVMYENIILEPSELQKEMVESLSARAHMVQRRLVDPKLDNMLKITTDGRKIGLDQRLIDPLLPESESSKTRVCSDKVFEIWEETKAKSLTQLVFCDFSTPKKDGRFSVYEDIRDKLLEKGIPEHEIAFIHDYETEARKKELFAKVRQGKIRVLFGSTAKMGAGTNVQDRLIANHDADCPWRPADLEQRAGRIERQGNLNPEVKIYRYATQGTFDSYLWQTVEAKQKFIAQITTSKSPMRSCEDVDETALSYAEIKALCAGNPLIAEKMNLDVEVARLRMIKSDFQSQKHRLEDDLIQRYPKQITAINERIAGIERDIVLYNEENTKGVDIQEGIAGAVSVTAKFHGMTIKGITYSEKEPAANALLEACKMVTSKDEVNIGSYMGFHMSLSFDSYNKKFSLLLRGSMTYETDLGTDAFGNITRINNVLDGLPKRLEGAKAQLENMYSQQEAAKQELQKPFALADELAEKEARLSRLNAELNIDDSAERKVLESAENRGASLGDYVLPDDYGDGERPIQSQEERYERQPASAKSERPSFLEEIRSFNAGRQQMPDAGKQQPTDTGKKTPGIEI